ncbi:nitroreductase family protein [bacterium]|nr:nitroreductase family protein [bacterium]
MEQSLHPIIKNRRSLRIIDPDRDIEQEKILLILEAARWAPSCSNKQAWRFVVVRKQSPTDLKQHISRGNFWAVQAPCMIAAVSKPDLGCRQSGRDYYAMDLGLAVENMLLQGTDLGLVMHPIAGFDEAGVKTELGIPQEYRIFALIVAGYPGDPARADAQTREKEQIPRERRPLEETVFWEQWPDGTLL